MKIEKETFSKKKKITSSLIKELVQACLSYAQLDFCNIPELFKKRSLTF